MRRVLAAALVLLCTTATATACGDDSGGDSDDGGSTETKVIEVTISEGNMTPSGERVEVAVDQPVDLVVTSDEPGEIHMHTEPAQTFEYQAGTDTFGFQISRPGIVEVESHTLDEIIVQLEVK